MPLVALLLACGCSELDAPGEAESTGRIGQADSLATSCGYTVSSGTYSKWPGGYQAWVEIQNVEGATGKSFDVLLDIGGATIASGYQATFTAEPEEDAYGVSSPSWLQWQTIPQGSSYRFAFVANGSPTAITPYIRSINGVACDTTPPAVELTASQSLFTADGTLTLTAAASDDVAVRRVVFERDGQVLGVDTTAPYTIQVPISTDENGRQRFTATAIDPSGNTGSDATSVLIAIGNRFFGGAPDIAADYEDFATYFDQVTPENGSKWGYVEATRDEMDFAELDVAYDFATTQGFPFKLHTLVWGQQEPAWVASLPPEEQLAELIEWMDALADRYENVAMIDVVNEPLHAPPSYAEALGGAGETGWDWVIRSFELARERFPESELLLNDYQVELLPDANASYLEIVELLQERGLIDGIGVQGHFLEQAEPEQVADNLDALAATGLPLYVTELDLNIANDALQANRMSELFPVFWEHPSVLGVTHWGHLQGSTWQPNAYLIRSDGTTRPALDWLVCYLDGGEECPVPEYVPEPREGTALGLTIEAESYDAAEGVFALGDVVAYTDDGDWVQYGRVVFEEGWDTFSVRYAKGSTEAGGVSVYVDSLESAPVATVELLPTAGWGSFETVEVSWPGASGEHDLFVVFEGGTGVANVDSFGFSAPVPDDGYGPNLVPNGDFESGTGGWYGWGGTLGVSTMLAHGGTQSLVVTNRQAGQGTAAIDLTSAVTPGATYQLRYFVSIDGAASAPVNITRKLTCAGESAQYAWVANSGAVLEGQWTELSGLLTLPDCEIAQLELYVEGPPAGVDLYVDDASVRQPLVENLVPNGTFESGIAGWYGWGGTLGVSTTLAHGGTQSLVVTNREANAGTAAIDLTSAVSPGASYQVRYFVSIGGAASAPVNITRKLTCAGESAQYAWVANSGAVLEGQWTELSGPLTLPDCEIAQLELYVEGPPAGVDLYVDDVLISP